MNRFYRRRSAWLKQALKIMKKILGRLWIVACILMLILGIVLAWTGLLTSDLGFGSLWFPAMILLVFPVGSVAYVVFFVLPRLNS